MNKKLITQAKAREIINLLSDYYSIPRPAVRFNIRRERGGAGIKYGKAYIKLPAVLTYEETALHEFAHVLHFYRLQIDRTRDLHAPHSSTFAEILFDVVSVWYGDPSKYNWSQEYRSIITWYNHRTGNNIIKHGITAGIVINGTYYF